MTDLCDLCAGRKGYGAADLDLSPTCNRCAILREVLQPYVRNRISGDSRHNEVVSLKMQHHGYPKYAITLSRGLNLSRLQWEGGAHAAVTLTAVPDKSNRWGLETSERDTCNEQPSLNQRDPILNLGESTGSLHTKELVRNWLQECMQHHKASCWRRYQTMPSENYPALPYRVLQIGTSPTNTIKLCEDTKKSAAYICMSYCWGNEEEPFITTKDNIERHKAGILIKELPLLFQQSIELARYLGFEYIWIDALCIVQHDKKDWENEAGKMAEIYSNSGLTIAATAARGPQDNLFKDRSLKTVQLTDESFQVQVTRHFPNDPRRDLKAVFPLLGRGWVYQERLLSPRVIHFGPDETIWECLQKRRCECGRATHMRDEIDKCTFLEYSDEVGSKHDSRMVGNFWRSMVVQYTGLTLTKPSDRLYALQGLRDRIGSARQKAFEDVYLAGLWQQTIALDLLWHVEYRRNENGDRTQEQLERAPTWSWASVDGPIEYPQALYCDTHSEVEQVCQVTVDNNNITDALDSEPIGLALITLECPSLKVTMDTYSAVRGDAHRSGPFHRGPIFFDYIGIPHKEELHVCLVAREGTRCHYALVLRACGQFFSRVGFVEVYKMDLPWSKETFIIR